MKAESATPFAAWRVAEPPGGFWQHVANVYLV